MHIVKGIKVVISEIVKLKVAEYKDWNILTKELSLKKNNNGNVWKNVAIDNWIFNILLISISCLFFIKIIIVIKLTMKLIYANKVYNIFVILFFYFINFQ